MTVIKNKIYLTKVYNMDKKNTEKRDSTFGNTSILF